MSAVLALLATLGSILAPCPAGIDRYELDETYADGSRTVGSFCDTGSEGPSLSVTVNAAGAWSIDIRTTAD